MLPVVEVELLAWKGHRERPSLAIVAAKAPSEAGELGRHLVDRYGAAPLGITFERDIEPTCIEASRHVRDEAPVIGEDGAHPESFRIESQEGVDDARAIGRAARPVS